MSCILITIKEQNSDVRTSVTKFAGTTFTFIFIWKCISNCWYSSNLYLSVSSLTIYTLVGEISNCYGYWVCIKHKTLWNCLCFSSSCFSTSRIRDFGIPDFKNLAIWWIEAMNSTFSTVSIDVRIYISISIRLMATKFGKQVRFS